jgi:hypothetical protein
MRISSSRAPDPQAVRMGAVVNCLIFLACDYLLLIWSISFLNQVFPSEQERGQINLTPFARCAKSGFCFSPKYQVPLLPPVPGYQVNPKLGSFGCSPLPRHCVPGVAQA